VSARIYSPFHGALVGIELDEARCGYAAEIAALEAFYCGPCACGCGDEEGGECVREVAGELRDEAAMLERVERARRVFLKAKHPTR
jgi:hypothetical protein